MGMGSPRGLHAWYGTAQRAKGIYLGVFINTQLYSGNG